MKGIIIYNGKYGATKQYTDWLCKELSMAVMTTDEINKDELNRAGLLLIGTSVYYGQFRIKDWLKNNTGKISRKKLFLFIVCGTPPEEKEERNKIVLDNVPGEIKQHTEIFFLPGRVIHKQLSWTDKLMLKMAEIFTKDPKKKQAFHDDLDGVKKENILPLVNAVNDFLSVRSGELEEIED